MYCVNYINVSFISITLDFSYKKYVNNVIIPIILVVISTIWIPIIVQKSIEPGLTRFLIISVLSFISIFISILYIGLIDKERTLIRQFFGQKDNI